MREEIEAAVLFITRLVNENISSSSSASSTHSSASSTYSSASSTSSESSPACFDEQTPTMNANGNELDKVQQFKQSLMKALYERFQNHWFPEQPTKGQAYRCIRLNECDRHDSALLQACLQCGIDYKDLQLPVELTLWVDPAEVTCRFGENKGSHCLVASFKDGHQTNLDINDINIDILRQTESEKNGQATTKTSPYGSPDHTKQHNQHHLSHNDNMNQNINCQFLQQNGHLLPNNNNYHHQQQAQQHHRHQNNLGKNAILQSYQNNYLTENPVYYYFNQ